jgi:hypothetical protein
MSSAIRALAVPLWAGRSLTLRPGHRTERAERDRSFGLIDPQQPPRLGWQTGVVGTQPEAGVQTDAAVNDPQHREPAAHDETVPGGVGGGVPQFLEPTARVGVEAGGVGIEVGGPVVDLPGQLRDALGDLAVVEEFAPLFQVGQQDRVWQGHGAHQRGVGTVPVHQDGSALLGHLRQQPRPPVDGHHQVLQTRPPARVGPHTGEEGGGNRDPGEQPGLHGEPAFLLVA